MSLRPEPFGALAYDFVTRKQLPQVADVVDVVRRLGDAADVEDALLGAGVPAAERDRYVAALGTLAASGIIRERVAA